MTKPKDASMADIIKAFDIAGWEKGFGMLLAEHKALENRHAFLASGDYTQQKQAQKLMPTLAKQDETLVRLRIIAKERGIVLDGRH